MGEKGIHPGDKEIALQRPRAGRSKIFQGWSEETEAAQLQDREQGEMGAADAKGQAFRPVKNSLLLSS